MVMTLKQIAKEAGVSNFTVSVALRDAWKSQRISEKRVAEIREIAKKMGYHPNLSARRLRTGKTFNVGVVIPGFLEHYPITTYFDLVTVACEQRGYHTIPLVMGRDISNTTKELDVLKNHHVDGLLFFDCVREMYDKYLQVCQENQAVVFRILDPLFLSMPFTSVLVNHYSAGKTIIKHLLDQGWTDMNFVKEVNTETAWDRGYGRAWLEFHNLHNTGCRDNVIVYGKRTALAKYKAIKHFIDSGGVKKGKTAFFMDGGDGSCGVYKALVEAGLVIGKDVAVAASNDLPAIELVDPEMTVFSEPFKDIAEAMVDQLLQDIEGKTQKLSSTKTFEPKLIPGPSTVRPS